MDDERESPCFKSALLKYSLHPVKFTEFQYTVELVLTKTVQLCDVKL